MTKSLDSYCEEIISTKANMLVPWWIMAAYMYEEGTPIITDGLFDKLADRLKKEWPKIKHHHKALLDRKSLQSSLAIGGKWPLRSRCAAASLLQVMHSSRRPSEFLKTKERLEESHASEKSRDSKHRSKPRPAPSRSSKKPLAKRDPGPVSLVRPRQ
jgi:hypothetical protein